METGHWVYQSDFVIDDWYGFVYRITNLLNGREYIGKKAFFNTTKRKRKGRKNRKTFKTESDWKEYMSSSDYLKEDIEKLGKDNFSFDIIELCKTKGDLTYREIEIQWAEKVLESTFDNGEKKYYNKAIGNIRYGLSKHALEAKKENDSRSKN